MEKLNMNIDISTVHAARISLSRVLDVSVNTIVSKKLYLESKALTLFRQQTHQIEKLTVTGFHYSTINYDYNNTLSTVGILNLFQMLNDPSSSLSMFLDDNHVKIDTKNKNVCYKERLFNIDAQREASDANAWYCLASRLKDDYSVNGFLADTEDTRRYSTVRWCPEILSVLDRALKIQDSLCEKWRSNCKQVIVKFEVDTRKLDRSLKWLLEKMCEKGFPENPNFNDSYGDHDILLLKNPEQINVSEVVEVILED